ncbi:predicted protein [Nematostella vectensis]|uniref:peptidylprolyl isomerase n=1 Tax=Nematostella vectensis TaxID=45351 RepID=A7RZA5_NEMVE|nr:predicted protein [Nematostella vectensis]|eukprot:XP_001635270.1 predicted protein [Nematostella vectensis]
MASKPLESNEDTDATSTRVIDEEEEYGVDITPKKDGGVRKRILSEGHGAEMANVGCTVVVRYVGKFLNGEEFDSNTGGVPFEFVLGESVVIQGWDIGVATMKKGEKALLTCKPEYAYGKQGGSKIPPNTTLQFIVELLDWKGINVTNKGEVSKVILEKGEGHARPNTGAVVNAHVTGSYDGKVFEEREVEFTFGEGTEAGLLEGVEEAIGNMTNKEKSKIFIQPGKYGVGPEGNPQLGLPPNALITYIIDLKHFENFKEAWELSNDEKITTALKVKDKGTKFFKDGKYKIACRQYAVVIRVLEGYFDEEEEKAVDPIKCAGHLNIAACHLKLGNNFKCIKACNKALDIDKENIKALFRRGKALLNLKDYEKSKEDFTQVLELDPKNREAREQLKIVNGMLKDHHQKEKKLYSNIFERLAEMKAKENKDQEAEAAEKPDVFQQAVDEAERQMGDDGSEAQGDGFGDTKRAPPDGADSDEDEVMAEAKGAVKC